MKQKVLIAEDHEIFRAGLKSLLSSIDELKIVGEAEDGQQVIKLSKKLRPDMIFMDLSMPVINGTEAMCKIKQYFPDMKFIVLTSIKTQAYIKASLDAGANAYVLKEDAYTDLSSAIKNVINGMSYLSPNICGKVIQGYLHHSASRTKKSWCELSVREREVTKLIAEGKKNKEIALDLSVCLKTVEKHRSNVMRKLDLHSGSAITRYAIEQKLISI